ncbi:MAG TPA: restriction system-associated AAA family ATPase [Pyrinomonadaceae bacterium]|jgi:type I restriction enzyme S subunit
MSIQNYDNLPKNWVLTTLGDVRVDLSQNINPVNLGEEMFELYSVPSYETGVPEIIAGRQIGSTKKIVKQNTVLLCKINPRINRVWIVGNYSSHQKIASPEWIGFEHIDGLEPKYIRYFLQQNSFRDFLAANVSGVGGSLMRIKPSIIADYPFPLAPAAEQKRIVEQIETQFTRLDTVVAGLKRIEANLSRLRVSILRAACEGCLVITEAKLAQTEKRNYEPADKLLSRITSRLRENREIKSVTKKQQKGDKAELNNWKTKYNESSKLDIDSLPNLPEGWIWALIRDVGKIQLGRQRAPKYRSKDYPTKYIRAANITEQGLDLTDVLEMEFKPEEREKYQLHYGDIVLSEASGSASQVGKPAMWRNELPLCCFQNTVIRIRPVELIPEYLLYALKNLYHRGIFAQASGGVNINHLSADRFSSLPIALPPLSEQKRIVDEIERRFSVIERIEKMVQIGLKRADLLQQRVLQLAFKGELVPQNSTDEPADTLLKKIKAQKAEREKVKLVKNGHSLKSKSTEELQRQNIQDLLPFDSQEQSSVISSMKAEVEDMKLMRLEIDNDYKSLHNFNNIFRKTESKSVGVSPICLVGLNGSGKSNLIESLSEIFCYLELINLPYESISKKYKQIDLRFNLEYYLPAPNSNEFRHIRIHKHNSSLPVFLELSNGTEKEIVGRTARLNALPTKIIGYSSGLNETISISYFKTKTLYSREVYGAIDKKINNPIQDSRTLFMDYDSNATILLANYLFDSDENLSLFREHLRINSVHSFEIVVKLTRPNNEPVLLTQELEKSIAKLEECANRIESEGGNAKRTFYYEVDEKRLEVFRKAFEDSKKFFKILHRLSLLNALALEKSERDLYLREGLKEGLLEPPPTVSKEDKIFSINNLKLNLTKPKRKIDYAGISDGEHQFLHIFGTIKLFDEPGIIFLLDEPETHFNPRWRREFVQLLTKIPSTEKQEFVISTHSPFIVSGCRKENVFKFERHGDVAICKAVDFETYGASFEFLLTELFDLKALISESALTEMKHLIEKGTEEELESAINRFGESFEKRFLFERLATLKQAKR